MLYYAMSRQGKDKTNCQDNGQQNQKGQKMSTENIKKFIEKISFTDDICSNITDYTRSTDDYVDDIFSTIADNGVDLYYSGLIDWLKENNNATCYIEQAVKNQGVDTNNFDFMRLIQAGQYEYNLEQLNENRHDILFLWCLQYCIDNDIELTDEQVYKVDDEIDDYVQSFDDLVEKINEIKGADDE